MACARRSLSCPEQWHGGDEDTSVASSPFSLFIFQRAWPRCRESRILLTPLEALLRFASQRLADREQKDGALALRMRRKEFNHVIVEEGQPGRAQVLSVRSQVYPAADSARLQLHRPVAAVPV